MDNDWEYSIDEDGSGLSSFKREAILEIKYVDQFDKFTYNAETGEYTCADVIECLAYGYGGGGSISQTLYCYNNVVKVADGKISHIQCDYYVDSETKDDETRMQMSFIYYNIGMAELEIPEDVKNTATPETPAPDPEPAPAP